MIGCFLVKKFYSLSLLFIVIFCLNQVVMKCGEWKEMVLLLCFAKAYKERSCIVAACRY